MLFFHIYSYLNRYKIFLQDGQFKIVKLLQKYDDIDKKNITDIKYKICDDGQLFDDSKKFKLR